MNFKNKKIAIIGVSEKPEKYGHRIFKDLLKQNYDVEGINQKGGILFGKKIYRSISELPQKPEIVITVVPPEITEKIVEECKENNINFIWMQPGSESEKAIIKAREYGIKTITACFMVQEKIW